MTRAAEQSKAFTLRLLPSSHLHPAEVLRVQSSSDLPPSCSCAHCPALGPKVLLAEPVRVRELVRACLCGVFCVVSLPVGSGASQIEFQRKKGIERCFMLLMPGWCSELNELNLRAHYILDLIMLLMASTQELTALHTFRSFFQVSA